MNEKELAELTDATVKGSIYLTNALDKDTVPISSGAAYADGVNFRHELCFPRSEERIPGSGTFMRISDGYLGSIVYLGFATPDDEVYIDPVGTGFLVSYEKATYIVTAGHVAAMFNQCPFAIRLNRSKELGQLDRIDEARWYFHPDDTIDVAVLPYAAPAWAQPISYIDTRNAITDFKRESKDIGPGDLAYVIGMYTYMPGTKRNIPVVHTGHIASMADGEMIDVEDWRPTAKEGDSVSISGYVIQVPTQRGSSGSPVFVRRSLEMEESVFKASHNPTILSNAVARNWAHGTVWLLGVWHGAWGLDRQFFVKERNQAAGFQEINVGMNMGVCVPSTRILETLDRTELIELRKQNSKSSAPVTLKAQSGKSGVSLEDKVLRTMLNTPPAPRSKSTRTNKAKRDR